MSTTVCKWSDLPPELLTLIGKRLETRIDVLRFRSVCSSWRFSLPSGTWPPPLPLTLPFPIVPHSFPHPRGHYALTEATVYRLQNLSNSPPKTWIIKVSENLPEGVTYDDFDNRIDWEQENQEMINTVQKAVFFNNLTVVVIHNNGDLAGLRLGDERWTPIVEYGGGKAYSDLMNFKGKIYAVSDKGDFLVIDSSLNIKESSSPWNYLSGNKKHLVESCGELWLLDRDYKETCFEAYKLKEVGVEHEWVEVSDLGDTILFASRDCCSFSVSAADFKGRNCKGNCIFFLNDSYRDSDDASVALWGPEYYNNYDVGLDDKEPQIYHVGDRCVDRLAAHPGFAHLFRPLPSLLASASYSSSQS